MRYRTDEQSASPGNQKEREFEAELLCDDGETEYICVHAVTCQDIIQLIKDEAAERQLKLVEVVTVVDVTEE